MYNAIRGKNKEITDPIKCDVMHKNKTNSCDFEFDCFGFEKLGFPCILLHTCLPKRSITVLGVPIRFYGLSFLLTISFRPRLLCEGSNLGLD